jgi:hypothetical protein
VVGGGTRCRGVAVGRRAGGASPGRTAPPRVASGCSTAPGADGWPSTDQGAADRSERCGYGVLRRDRLTRPWAGAVRGSRGGAVGGGSEHSRASSGEAQAGGRRRLRLDWVTRKPPGRESVRRRAASAPIRFEERSQLRPPTRGSARVARKDNFAAAPSLPPADRLRSAGTGISGYRPPPPPANPAGGTSSAPLRLRP